MPVPCVPSASRPNRDAAAASACTRRKGLLQAARALQESEAQAGYRAMRQVVEHRLARLVQLGLRQARYVGRRKTEAQLYLTAAVANLTLVLNAKGAAETA